VAGGGLLLATSLAGIGVGAYLGGMVGLNIGNTRHNAFEQAIERGELLVIADVPRFQVEEITERIREAHPRAQARGAFDADQYRPPAGSLRFAFARDSGAGIGGRKRAH
jgi:hypothetical protein